MGAEYAQFCRELHPVKHTFGITPGYTHHCREVEPLCFIREDLDNLLEFVQFNGIKLAVAIGCVDAVNAGCVKTPNILTEYAFVETVIRVKRGSDCRPHTVQIFAGQALTHQNGHRYCRCSIGSDSSSSAMACATRRTTARSVPLSGCIGGSG